MSPTSRLCFWFVHVGLEALADLQRSQIAPKTIAGRAALELMNRHLKEREWMVGEKISLADICLFAYTHVADEAGHDLALYGNVVDWMEWIMEHPSHEPML